MPRPDALAAIDLNLLVVLRALLDEGSVHGAARRLGRSPSATSHALMRLRELLGDELFVRVGSRMVPSPRAESLKEPVRQALSALERTIEGPRPFEPATATGTLRLAAVDLAQTLLLAELLVRLRREAPGLRVVVMPIPEQPTRALAEGAVDLVLGGLSPERDLARVILLRDPFVCVVRAGHPCLAAPFTVDVWAALPHVLIQPRGGLRGYVDAALQQVGRERQVVCVTPSLALALEVVARSDLVLTTTSTSARQARRAADLALLPPPLPVEPYTLAASWHARRADDPLVRWVATELQAIGAAIVQQIEHAT
jgi:DNA-binding transcriptional LysR family regulator